MIIKLDFMLQSFRQATSAVDQFVVLGLDSGKDKVPLVFSFKNECSFAPRNYF